MKTLLVMRHGKSDWYADYESDHDRPLNERGIRNARQMGLALSERDIAPDHLIGSTALRARSTAQLAAEAGSWTCDLEFDRAIYESGVDGVVDVASRAPDVGRLMIVGHQPTWSMLIARLTGEEVEMKTASVALITVSTESWVDLGDSRASLETVLHPRDLE